MKYFIDANVILRFLLGDSADHFDKAVLIFESIAEGRSFGYINSLVIHEVLYVAIYTYKEDRKTITMRLIRLIQLSNLGVLDISKEDLIDVLNSFSKLKIDFPDLVYAKICENNKMPVVSFDRHLDKLKVKRIESI